MAKITIRIDEQYFEPDRPYITTKITVENYEAITDGEKYILDKLVPIIKNLGKEYTENY